MIKSFMQIFRLVTEYRGRLILSQVSLFISAIASVGFATLVAPMVNQKPLCVKWMFLGRV